MAAAGPSRRHTCEAGKEPPVAVLAPYGRAFKATSHGFSRSYGCMASVTAIAGGLPVSKRTEPGRRP